jgi:ADP-heptose:LPS heptosyltransferase
MAAKLKYIELWLKKKINSFLKKDRQPILIEKTTNKFFFVEGSRILLLRHDRIGDVMVSVPFIKLLREVFPIVELDILLSSNNIAASAAVKPYVNNIYVYDKGLISIIKLLRQLNKAKYDMIIDLFDNSSTTSSMIIKFANPLYSLGINKNNNYSYSHVVPLLNKNKYHIVERIAQLILPFGINPSSQDLKLSYPLTDELINKANNYLSNCKSKFKLGINLSGSNRSKYWGTENYIEFIKYINNKEPHFDVVIFYTPEYEQDFKEISENSICFKAPPGKSFDEYAAMLSLCNVILTPDTAAVHIAAAFKIPCIGLFLWTGSKETGLPWFSYNSPYRCLKTSTGKLENVSVEDVINAIDEIVMENKLGERQK